MARGQDVRVPSRRRVFDYQRLFQVALRHEYYGRRHAAGELFQTAPTPSTSARVQALGMLLRPERDGFSVLYDTAQTWNARARGVGEAAPLSFEVVCTSPHFVSITEMDLDTSPRTTPFHASNRVPGDAAATAAHGGRSDAPTEPGSPVPLLPELRPAPSSVARMIQVASSASPIPIVTIDIFLGGADWRGRCPMPPADGPYEPLSVSYDVVFAARRTFWRYHIVPQAGSGPLDNLTIDPAMFLGPFHETLVNGDQGHRFLSKVPIALASHSSVRWSLHGRRRERMTRDAMLVERLPVPAVDQLGLLTADEREMLGAAEGVCSEMFVYV